MHLDRHLAAARDPCGTGIDIERNDYLMTLFPEGNFSGSPVFGQSTWLSDGERPSVQRGSTK